MKTKYLIIAGLITSSSLLRAQQNLVDAVKQGISEGEQENKAFEKIVAIKNKSPWKGEDEWFYNIAKEQENRFLIQKVKIIPKKGLTDVPQIATLSIHVDGSGTVKDQAIDVFMFPLNASMGSYLDKGIISRDRGGLLGAAVGSMPEGCSGGIVPINLCDDLAVNVIPKFYEWEKIAREKNVAPFIKYFDGRKFYDTWDIYRGMEEKDENKNIRNKMLKEWEMVIGMIKNSKKGDEEKIKNLLGRFHGGAFDSIIRANKEAQSHPGESRYMSNLNDEIESSRKDLEFDIQREIRDHGVIRDPSYEQTGWVFVWNGGKAYAFNIQSERNFSSLNLLLNGGDSEVALANLSGDSLLSKEDIDGFKMGYDFIQTVRKDASKYVSEYSATQSRQSSEQDALFK